MSEGFLAFKWIGWGAAALLAVAALAPSNSTSQWNRLGSADMQSRPGLLKKRTAGGGGTTTTTTTTSGTVTNTTAGALPELSMIPSNFDVNSWLVPWPASPTGAPDIVGAFRFMCNAGQLLRDDPIMYPGQPGKSHLHQFYGNTKADAYSTYQSLRTTGDSTCVNPLNRSAYWMPALLDGKGNVVRPDTVTIYYKRPPKTSSWCSDGKVAPKGCTGLPNGLRYIMGRDMMNLDQTSGGVFFMCQETGYKSGNMEDVLANCLPGQHFEAAVSAPPCWDGKNLDSSNHRDHMSYFEDSHMGYARCPLTHPYWIPTFSLATQFTIVAGDDLSKWTFSSDGMMPGAPRGSSFHADWFGAWDPTALAMWQDNCIEKLLSCNSGDLGNGKGLRMYSGFSWTANPRLVPIPG